MKEGIFISKGILWTFIWFGFMSLYTLLNIVVWRKLDFSYGKYLNLFTIIFCVIVFLLLLSKINNFKIDILKNISFQGLLLSLACAGLFYFILDKGLDPLFAKIFPTSEESYQQTLQSLSSAPILSLIQVCVLAPIIEEILMRGFLLGGLLLNYGKIVALFISAFFFAFLHFNMVQTLSAFLCGIILGLLYLYTGSIFCCILAHMGYNLISYITVIVPVYNRL